MLESQFHIPLRGCDDLREPTWFERARVALGGAAPDLRTGSRVLPDPVQAVNTLFLGLYTTGLVDVLSVMVDDRLVFVDRVGDGGHLARAHALTLRALQGARPFQSLQVAVEVEHEGLQVLVQVDMASTFRAGSDALQVRLSAKIDQLAPRVGESARGYDRRLRAFAASYTQIEGYRLSLQGLAERVGETLAQAFDDAPIRFDGTWIRVVQVQPAQIGAFRDLLFGNEVLRPRYRPMPQFARRGVYSDPFVYFYFDPYYDFLNWVVLDAVLYEAAWRTRDVRVVEPAGTLVFRGHEADRGAHSTGTLDAVGFTRTGHLRVNPVVPRPKVSGDPLSHMDGWEPVTTDWLHAQGH